MNVNLVLNWSAFAMDWIRLYPQEELCFKMIDVIAELERKMIVVERTKAGLAASRARGRCIS